MKLLCLLVVHDKLVAARNLCFEGVRQLVCNVFQFVPRSILWIGINEPILLLVHPELARVCLPLIKFVDMFSGIGGFREGLTRAGGFECVGHCEIDKYANRSYNALFDTKGEWFIEDARKADPSTMPDFQLLCGGFPCQTFSIAGSRKGFGDPRGTLFFELARLAEARKPPYLLFENVPGLLSHDGGRTFATILNTLDRLGYGVEWQCLNSKPFDYDRRAQMSFKAFMQDVKEVKTMQIDGKDGDE